MGLLAAVCGAFSSCATEKSHATALVGDPDSRADSSIPWNRPEHWEAGAGLPAGLGSQGKPANNGGY